jgi:hypothetical protein
MVSFFPLLCIEISSSSGRNKIPIYPITTIYLSFHHTHTHTHTHTFPTRATQAPTMLFEALSVLVIGGLKLTAVGLALKWIARY